MPLNVNNTDSILTKTKVEVAVNEIIGFFQTLTNTVDENTINKDKEIIDEISVISLDNNHQKYQKMVERHEDCCLTIWQPNETSFIVHDFAMSKTDIAYVLTLLKNNKSILYHINPVTQYTYGDSAQNLFDRRLPSSILLANYFYEDNIRNFNENHVPLLPIIRHMIVENIRLIMKNPIAINELSELMLSYQKSHDNMIIHIRHAYENMPFIKDNISSIKTGNCIANLILLYIIISFDM